MKKIMRLQTQICIMFEPMTGLGCSVTILLLADLDNMSLFILLATSPLASKGFAPRGNLKK